MGYTARALERAGATHLAIPCNTAHCFLSELAKWTNLPILDMIELTIRSVIDQQVSQIGLLATDGTVKIELFQQMMERISKELNTRPIEMIVPNAKGQCVVDDCIKRIKAGDVGAEVEHRLLIEAQSLADLGADIIITGCTELPLVLSDELVSSSIKFVDPMRILALEIIRLTVDSAA
jgi:aspartate racemase